MIGREDSEVIKGTWRSIKEYNMQYELLSPKQVKEKYPMFLLSEGEVGLFEETAGIAIEFINSSFSF